MERGVPHWAAGLGLAATTAAVCLSLAPSGGDRRLEVVGVETETEVIRLNELHGTPDGRAVSVESLSGVERDVVEAALDDGYVVDEPEPPASLVRFLAETPYVVRDGVYHRIDHDFPRYTITARTTTEDAVPGRIASAETYERAVTHEGRRRTPLLERAREGGVTKTYLPESLRAFLTTYDAVRVDDLVSLSFTVADDGPPYEVTAERIDPTDTTEDPVYDATSATEPVRDAIRAAGTTDGVYAGDVPTTVLDAVATHEYVFLDGTFYWARLETRGSLPVSLDATVVQPVVSASQEARLRLTLTNEGDEAVSVFSGAPPPFGVLYAEAVGDGDRSLLWTDAYRENDHVTTESRRVTAVQEVGQLTPLSPGSRVDQTFTLTDPLDSGDYVVRDDLGVETADGERLGTLLFTIRLGANPTG